MTHDSMMDTLDHIAKVTENMSIITDLLDQRAAFHDESKLSEPEKSGYDRLVINLKDCEYGSDEYKAALEEAKPTLEHHYSKNSHHPQHWENGINGMSLLDIVEMLADWQAASQRTLQGSIQQSLPINKERFGISDQLYSILCNTIKELGW